MRTVVEGVDWGVKDLTILHEVSAEFPAGSVTGLIGPNGSGKTSLLHVVAGLRRPSQGRVEVGGEDVHAWSARVRARRIALLEQHASTSLDLTVRQVVELGRTPHRGRWPGRLDEGRRQVESALELGRVADLADRRWQTLSGGERQRVQLARSLAQEPSLLMLDEPTNHLDLRHQIDFLTTVRDLGITTIAALHDLDLAAAFCDRLVVMRGGHVVAAGPVESVLSSALVLDVFGVRTTIDRHAAADRWNVVWHR
ncbi:ABC transporter ATP-binding protein [Aeromicrobium stalagmiti]|uniref:ABC transporter ATP-binding protein n=1 Tax=Aeromicrobium stalagmiti TaxID=2738988 RepID=UPI0015687B53|nr:ABC transporter ATP-binding protein [Aeromicrobium stalagmiti]NRQ49651.1 ABC transporter ATP-binding protein [Aeromicrobium stalagmiti]